MADEAIQYMKQLKELAPDKPFLVYYVPGGTHAPHHPTPEWIKKISDMHLFDGGWNQLRETIFANQKTLGIMPENAQLTPWPDGQDIYGGAKLPRWDSLDWEQKKLFIKQAEVYGAYQAYTDHEIGRVIQAVEDLGELNNTLIIYISGDNGASAEGMLNGTPNEFTTFNGVEVPVKDQSLWYEFWGSERTYPHFAAPRVWAFDTPFKWCKQVASHFDNTTLTRWNSPKPSLTAGRTDFTYTGGLTDVPGSTAPDILNKAYTITAEVTIPEGGAEGMIVTQGGRFGGYGLFLSKGELGIGRGKVVFLYNLLDLKRTTWDGPELGAGKHTIVFDYKPAEPGLGKGGTGVLSVDGKEVAKNSMEHSTPITFPEDETSTSARTPARRWRSSSIATRCRSNSPARSTS